MRSSWRRLLLVLLLAGSAGLPASLPGPARAVGEGGDEPEPARRLPPRWRDDPDQYRRLKEEWKAFHKLPPDHQARLRQVDEELNDEPPATRARLWAVLDRYVAWLDRLDDKDRQQVESAPDAAKKLEIIKALREREWVAHLPKADRDRIEQAPPDQRAALIDKLRQRERERRADWHLAFRLEAEQPPPQLPPELRQLVRLYAEKSLIPTLTFPERDRLRKAALGGGPEYARQLATLADKHPILVPPGERPGVTTFKDLPPGLGQSLLPRQDKGKGFDHPLKELRELQGRWPNFALALDRVARNRKVSLPDKPLGPCKPEEFVPRVQNFIANLRKDDPAAAKKLDEAQGKWPDYPFAVMELAKAKGRRVPGTFLPGPKEFWEKAKAGQAE